MVSNISRYGAHAVMGRPLYHHEILRMNTAEQIATAYKEKYASENWAEWAKTNPGKERTLNQAMRLAREYGWECN